MKEDRRISMIMRSMSTRLSKPDRGTWSQHEPREDVCFSGVSSQQRDYLHKCRSKDQQELDRARSRYTLKIFFNELMN